MVQVWLSNLKLISMLGILNSEVYLLDEIAYLGLHVCVGLNFDISFNYSNY